jgi:CHAT domain-containing protein/Tfp pilus assembly protein PilF
MKPGSAGFQPALIEKKQARCLRSQRFSKEGTTMTTLKSGLRLSLIIWLIINPSLAWPRAQASQDVRELQPGASQESPKSQTTNDEPQQSGLVVEEVVADSPAAKAGLKVGDRVLSYDGKSLPSPAALQAVVENTFGKEALTLRVRRGEETLLLTVPPGRLGVQARPELPPAVLTLYEQGKAAQQARKMDEVIAKWTAAAKAAQDAGDNAAAAWLHGRVGEIYESQRQWKEASAAHASAWELLKQSSDAAAQSLTLAALGRCSQNLNDFPAAHRWFEQAQQVDAAAGNEMWVTADLNSLGFIAANRSDLTAAHDYFSRALAIRERLAPNSLPVATTFNSLGNVARSRGDLAAAHNYYNRALAIRERLAPNSLPAANSLNNLGVIARARGDLVAAQDYHHRALVIRERLAPNSLDIAASLNNLGVLAFDRGDLAAAQDYYTRALAIQERLAPDLLNVATSLNNLGNVSSARGDLEAAQGYYSRALAIKERLVPNSLDVAMSLSNLGNIAHNRGDLTAAQDSYSRALVICERLAPNSLIVAASLNNLGNIARKRGDLPSAQDYHRRALVIQERLAPNSLDVATSLSNLGVIARNRGDFLSAQDYHSRALVIQERLAPNSLDVAASLYSLGNIAFDRGDLTAAQDYHSRAIVIREQLAPNSLIVAASLNGLGAIALNRGDLAVAQDYCSRALVIKERLAPDSLTVVYGLNNLGVIALKQRRFSDALPLLTRAVEIVEAQRRQIPSTEARAFLIAQHTEPYTELMRAQLALNDLPAAFATLERARARSLLELLAEARADIRQGVDSALLKRERALQELLNAKEDRRIQALTRSDEKQATMFTKEIEGLLTQYKEVQAEIRAKSPKYAALTQPQPLGLKEIQEQVLDEETLLLEYVLGEEQSYLWAVTTTSIKSYELPKRKEIEDAAKQVYKMILTEEDMIKPGPVVALSQMLLGPVADELNKKRLVIVTDGALQYLPFGALPKPVKSEKLKVKSEEVGRRTNDSSLFTPHSPLILDHEVVHLPSASVLAVLRKELAERQAASKTVAVLADPVFQSDDPRVKAREKQIRNPKSEIRNKSKAQNPKPNTSPPSADEPGSSNPQSETRNLQSAGPQSAIRNPQLEESAVLRSIRELGLLRFDRLPQSRIEANQITALAAKDRTLKALDFAANRATATNPELGQYRIVHFATHSLLNNEHPELSGVVLSLVDEQGKPQDGFLRLHEVYNLSLGADLVVLSACRTSLGKEIKGEGLIGLTRGFMYAGAPRVVASLWDVNDEATAELMKRFYQGMLKEGSRPAAALRAAQLAIRRQKRWRSPFYWAGFVLLGEWK